MQFEFETWCTLQENAFIFEFRRREFKLLSGHPDDRDCLLSFPATIEKPDIRAAQRDAMLFLACLAWEHHTPFVPEFGGGGPTADTILEADRVKRGGRWWPPKPRPLQLRGLPAPETPEHETALGLYREAMGYGSEFYRFLCLWNILSIPGRSAPDVIRWINDTFQRAPGNLTSLQEAREKHRQHGSLGSYLNEECRDAVAHVTRNLPTKTPLDPNSWDDLHRISEAGGFLMDLVKVYVTEDLRLTNRMSPVQIPGEPYPVYRT